MNKLPVLLLIASGCVSGFVSAQSGKELFGTYCSGCHGANAEGIEGLAPSLHNPQLWSKLGDKRNQYIAGVVTSGLSGKLVSLDKTYQGFAMPPQSFISSQDLVQITHYVLEDVNQQQGGPDQALIDEYKKKPFTHSELHQLRKGG